MRPEELEVTWYSPGSQEQGVVQQLLERYQSILGLPLLLLFLLLILFILLLLVLLPHSPGT